MSADYDEVERILDAAHSGELANRMMDIFEAAERPDMPPADPWSEVASAVLDSAHAAFASIAARARAQAGEDIALAIEAERASLIDGHNKFAHTTIAHYADGLNRGARIARATTKAGAQQARSPVVPSDKSPITGRYR